MLERQELSSKIESQNAANESLSKKFKSLSYPNIIIRLKKYLVCVIIDSMNLQVNVPYTLIITSNNNNNVCVTNNDIQSYVKTNKDYSDDEDMLIDYEASDNNETSFSESVDKINEYIDICSTFIAKNHNLLNLTPNL